MADRDAQFRDRESPTRRREPVRAIRDGFTSERHADRLLAPFRQVIGEGTPTPSSPPSVEGS